MPVVVYQIAAESDDSASNIYGDLNGQTFNILGDTTFVHGLRFADVQVPRGATITAATLSLYVWTASGNHVEATWRTESSDNSFTFFGSSDRTVGRPDRRVMGSSSDYSFVDLDPVTYESFSYNVSVINSIREVLSRPGWQPGNALTLLGKNDNNAEVFDNTIYYRTYEHSPATSAKLTIEYFIPTTPTAPATDWSALGKEDKKEYVYRVSKADGTYIGVWGKDVSDQPAFTQALNTPGTMMTVQLARSPANKKEERSYLLTATNDRLVTEAGEPLVSVFESPNNVGPGTDVDLNYNVDVYVVYGDFGRLITSNGDYLTTESGDYLLAASGSPYGKRVFSGFILDYETEYGDKNGVTVTLASHGYELEHQPVLSGTSTTVTYSTTELGAMTKTILDTNPGKISYDIASITNTSVSRTLKFVVNNKKQAFDTIYGQTPSGWWWYVDPGDNLLYLKPKSATADHTFVLGRDIMSLKVKQTIESMVNEVYFIGGETTPGNAATTLYKRFTDPTSLTAYPRRGLKRITDRRYTSATNAQARAEKDFSRYANPIFTSPLVISASRYDIETIKLGQTVQVRGTGSFIDALPPLQIVRRSYTPTRVVLELGESQESQVDTLADVQDALENEQFIDLPNAPA